MSSIRRAAVLAATLLSACASSHISQNAAHIPLPNILIIGRTDLTDAPAGARGLNVHYEFRIANQAQVPITLKRIDLEGLGAGGINIESKTRMFSTVIQPGTQESVDFVTAAYIPDPTSYMSRSPVQIRAVALFDSPEGSLQRVVQQQVRPEGGSD